VRGQGTERGHDAFDVLSPQGGNGGARARVGNAHELDAGQVADQLHAQVTHRTHAGVTDAHGAGVLLRVLDQFHERLVRRIAAHHEHAGRTRAEAERHKVAERVVGNGWGVENGTKRERAVLGEQDGVAVLCGLDDAVGADRPPAARAIHDDDRRLEHPRDLVSHCSCADVGGIAWCERYHDADRPGRECLGMQMRRREDKREAKKDPAQGAIHG
jgi:hypothetical protein